MSERVLIVDDDPVQRRLLDNMVRKLGYEAAFAAGGDAAIAALTDAGDARIDAVVLDLVMPDLDGFGVLARMRAAGLGLPVIVQTAHDGIDAVITAMRAGATDFVVKPVGAERLQVSLRNALAARALEGEIARIKQVTGFIASGSVAPELTICEAASAPPLAAEGSTAAARARHHRSSLAPAVAPTGVIALLDGNGEMRPLEDIEAETIRFAISHYRGQMSEVARRLRIGRSTLYRKLASLGLDADLSDTEVPAL